LADTSSLLCLSLLVHNETASHGSTLTIANDTCNVRVLVQDIIDIVQDLLVIMPAAIPTLTQSSHSIFWALAIRSFSNTGDHGFLRDSIVLEPPKMGTDTKILRKS
jgi:hypothetical protein